MARITKKEEYKIDVGSNQPIIQLNREEALALYNELKKILGIVDVSALYPRIWSDSITCPSNAQPYRNDPNTTPWPSDPFKPIITYHEGTTTLP